MDVSTAFIRDMQTLGYRKSLSQYTAFRIHVVNAAFVRDLRDLGLKDLSADQLVAMRIHGKLIEMRIHGIDADFLRKAQ